MLEFFENLFLNIDPFIAYLVLFVSAFVENVVPPVPGDTVVVLGAYLVSIGQLGFWGVYVSTTLGSVAGFATMYYVGLKFGRSFFFEKSRGKIFKEEQIAKVENWFGDWGYWVILANRFLSGTRSVISVFAGLFHLSSFKVIGLSLISAAIWNALLIWAGMLLGNNWHHISDIISQYNRILFVVLGLLVLVWLIRKYIKRNRSKNSE